MSEFRIITGDCLESLKSLPAGSVRCCVTSPPYWGLRDYGTAKWEGGDAGCDHSAVRRGHGEDEKQATSAGTSRDPIRGEDCRKCGARRIDAQIGLEPTPEAYVARMVEVFREVRRVLADDGTLWLNLGDSYANTGGMTGGTKSKENGKRAARMFEGGYRPLTDGLKQKDLCGIPWMVAFAIRADGWYLRSDIIWHKPNPMPESVTDRPTKSHEYLFLLAKSPTYYYDAAAVAEPAINAGRTVVYDGKQKNCETAGDPRFATRITSNRTVGDTRNRRTVWTVATQPFKGAHFATFPPKLIEPCILAGSAEGDAVLDPFNGSGTTGLVALRHGRKYIGLELNPEYVAMTEKRLKDDAPLLNKQEAVA